MRIFYALGRALRVLFQSNSKSGNRLDPKAREKLYYFQFTLLPKLVHRSGGSLFSDERTALVAKLTRTAHDIAGPSFAAAFAVRPLPEPDQMLIVFETPSDVPFCLYALIVKRGDSYRYFTLELSQDIMASGAKTVLGECEDIGSHINWGTRAYTDPASFIADALKIPDRKSR